MAKSNLKIKFKIKQYRNMAQLRPKKERRNNNKSPINIEQKFLTKTRNDYIDQPLTYE